MDQRRVRNIAAQRLSLVPHYASSPALGAFFMDRSAGHKFLWQLDAVWRNSSHMTDSDTYSDALLTKILRRTKTVAVVGVSTNPVWPSYFVARYLSLKGFTVVPVNPGHAGKMLFGQTIRASLSEITAPVDMVDIFRRSDAVPAIVDEALAHLPHLKTIWMQIGVSHAGAAQKARDHGVDVVQNRCPKIEYQRLFGELRMGGFNTGVISSKL
jgi:predicted CoA-binding protein